MVPSAETILLVDDEAGVLKGQKTLLELNGYREIRQALNGDEARSILEQEEIALTLLDLTMPGESGESLLAEIHSRYPETVVIVVTGAADLSVAVECMKAGAYDFLVKGTDTSRIPQAVRNALEHRRTIAQNRLLRTAITRAEPRRPDAFREFRFVSEVMQRIFVYLELLAPMPDVVLICGETGVGKELVARGVHRASRRAGEFVPVNLGGVDDHVFSDTLFGHRRGAFTGADAPREGLVRAASQGTLFLDEIGEMPMESQTRLLRLLDSGEYRPLGSDRQEFSTARIICATNRDLEEAVADGTFRRDLYYRIATHQVTIPPLRERVEDIPAILDELIRREAERIGKAPLPVPPAVVRGFQDMQLPGNVRELQQHVLRALITSSWETVAKLPVGPASVDPSEGGMEFPEMLPTPDELISALLREADRRYPGNRGAAAAAIGLSPQAFSNRLRRYLGTTGEGQ